MDIKNSKYYINQSDSDIKEIKFKNGTNLGAYGCGVCSFAMIICEKQKIVDRAKQLLIVKEIVSKITNENGDLVYTNFVKNTINGVKYSCNKIGELKEEMKNVDKNNIIVQVPGHFVVAFASDKTKQGYESVVVADPGKRKNTNLQQVLNDYKAAGNKAAYVLV